MAAINGIGQGIDFQFLQQRLDTDDYGTAVPLLLAEDFIGNEPFYYLSGDDVLIDAPGISTLRNLADHLQDGASGLVTLAIDHAESVRYGALDVAEEPDGRRYLAGLREKQTPSAASTECLINISRYLLPPAILDVVRKVPADSNSGEHRITDALLHLVDSGRPPTVYVTDAQYFDIGNQQGLLAANNYIDRQRHP